MSWTYFCRFAPKAVDPEQALVIVEHLLLIPAALLLAHGIVPGIGSAVSDRQKAAPHVVGSQGTAAQPEMVAGQEPDLTFESTRHGFAILNHSYQEETA